MAEGTWDLLNAIRGQQVPPAPTPMAAPTPAAPGLAPPTGGPIELPASVWSTMDQLKFTPQENVLQRLEGATAPTALRRGPASRAGKRRTAEDPTAGPRQAASGLVAQIGTQVQANQARVQPAVASGDPKATLAAIKNEVDALGVPNAPAKLYERTGRSVDKDFKSIIEAYGLDKSGAPSEENIGYFDMNKDEKAAFLFDMGLNMMAVGGQPGSENMSVLGILGGAAKESLGEVRNRRQRRGQERRELGKLLLQERQYQGGLEEKRAQRRLEKFKADETIRHNKALESYQRASIAKGSIQQLSSDMQLLGYIQENVTDGDPVEAIKVASNYKNGGKLASSSVTVNRTVVETAQKMLDAERASDAERLINREPDYYTDRWKELTKQVRSEFDGKVDELGFEPPSSMEEADRLASEDPAKFLEWYGSDLFTKAPPEVQKAVDAQVKSLQLTGP